ncbi:hypothetical protein Gpo141_00012931 [Globisporangium polare]
MAYPTPSSSTSNGTHRTHGTRMTSLSLIDTFTVERILKRNKHKQFVISVFQHHQPQKTPLTLLSPTELFFRTRQSRYLRSSSCSEHQRGEPDFEILHRYSEFVKLRHKISAITADAHHQQTAGKLSHCAFCSPLVEFISHDSTRPSKTLKLISSSKTHMERLASFVRRLTGMVVNGCMEARPQQQGNCCDAALQAAMVLEDFLRKPRQPLSLGII